jgi:hypothetical protein
LRRHRDRLRRIVSIRLTVRLARMLEEGGPGEEALRAALLAARERGFDSEAELLACLASVVERELLQRGEGAPREAREPPRSLRLSAENDLCETRVAEREDLERLVDARVAALEPELREVVLLRDYCGADWELVRARLDLMSLDAAQALYRCAHERLARRVHSHRKR